MKKWKLILVLVFLATEVVLSKQIWLSMYGCAKILEIVFFAFFISQWISSSKMKHITTLFSIDILVESFLAIAQHFHKGSIGGIWYFLGERSFNSTTVGIANASIHGELFLRPYATFSHPNVLAGYLLIGITLLCFYFQRRMGKKTKILYSMSILLGAVALLLTLSRVAIVLCIIIFLIKWFRIRNKKTKLLIPAIGTIIILAVAIASPLSGRFTSLTVSDESFVKRGELIKASIDMIKTHPLLGVGIGNFLQALPSYYPKPHTIFYLQPVHNIFLLVAAEQGLIGFSIALFLVFKTISHLKKKKEFQISNFKFQILCTVLILGLFDHYFLTLQQGQLLLGFILGICLSKKTLQDINTRGTIRVP